MIFDNLPEMFSREILFLRFHISEFAFVSITLRLQRLPFLGLFFKEALLVFIHRLISLSLWRHCRWSRSSPWHWTPWYWGLCLWRSRLHLSR